MAKPRVRRSPEEARRTILDAALRVLAQKGPDAAGLQAVAREAGVSHALVTHYFGTYDRLVEEAFAEHVARTRASLLGRLLAGGATDLRALVRFGAETLTDPLYARLAAWALLSGRADAKDFFSRRDQGLRRIADAVSARLALEGRRAAREEVELGLLLVFSASLGYALGRRALWAGLGEEATPDRDAWFRERLAGLVDGMIPPPRRRRRAGQRVAR